MKDVSIEKLDEQIKKLSVQKFMEIEKGLNSNNAQSFMKAQAYLNKFKGDSAENIRSFLFDPYNTQYNGSGYKTKEDRTLTYEILRVISETPIVKSVHNTRLFQIEDYLKFTDNDQVSGYTIRKKLSLFEKKPKETPDDQKKTIEYIVEFLQNSRIPQNKSKKGIYFDSAKYDIYEDLNNFGRMIMQDSLTFDQVNFELQRTRGFNLYGYMPVDASTIRYLDTIDPKHKQDSLKRYDVQLGYLPRYAQVYNNMIYKDPQTNQPKVFYPWEMAFAVRNKSTNIRKVMYGTSELETLEYVIAYIENGLTYNGNFFKQGSNPKGFINIKGNGNQDVINDFRNAWRTMVAGVQNSHKLPIFEGVDIDWVDMQQSNKDMEFQAWLEFTIILFCSVYAIDPSECGFDFDKKSRVFGQDGQKERLKHSKDKGLKPLLLFLQKVINRYIISDIDPDYEFVFTGIDIEDEESKLKNDRLKLDMGVVSLEDKFEEYSGRKLDPESDTILNQIYLQYRQVAQYGGQESNQAVNEITGEKGKLPNPFEEYEKGGIDDPITKECFKYIDKEFGYEKQI